MALVLLLTSVSSLCTSIPCLWVAPFHALDLAPRSLTSARLLAHPTHVHTQWVWDRPWLVALLQQGHSHPTKVSFMAGWGGGQTRDNSSRFWRCDIQARPRIIRNKGWENGWHLGGESSPQKAHNAVVSLWRSVSPLYQIPAVWPVNWMKTWKKTLCAPSELWKMGIFVSL